MIRILLCAWGFALAYAATGQPYEQVYSREAAGAISFCRGHQALWDSVFKPHQIKSSFALSIVAPEIGHYSIWQDQMETTAVSLFYVEMGDEYSDFSIGYFQMKPSFAEKVEEFVHRLSLVQFEPLVKFTGTSVKAIRNERVERLGSLSFQAGYLAAFMVIWDRLHPAASHDESAHLRELATAYNVGFWKDEKDIQRWGSRKSFPARRKIQFSYADIAAEYFERL